MLIQRFSAPGTRFAISVLTLVAALLECSSTPAQTASPALAALRPVAQANRINAGASLAPQTQLTGHIPAWVTATNQVASHSVDLSSTMHLTITLRRDPAVEASFTQFLANQQNPSSPLYHQWLTPQQVGQFFGLTDSDIAAVSGWLTGQGLTVSVEPSRNRLKVTGSAASIAAAFHTSFSYFNAAGQQRLSAMTEPFIPAAFAPVVGSIGGLTEIPFRPYSHAAVVKPGSPADAAATGVHPNLTVTSNGVNSFFITPKDFAVIYDISGIYSGGNTGATIGSKPQHVAIMGESRVASTDISEFAANVSLGSYNLNTIVPPAADGGVDPGITNTSAQDEATLDVDRVISTAPGVIADLLVSTAQSGGVAIGLDYNVNILLDPIQTVSFGACEIDAGQAAAQQDDQFFQQAAAEGISTFISSGDSGANACANSFSPVSAGQTYTASINYLCSSSYVTCVGGTEFNDTANPTLYWSTKNGTGLESALSYIPEGGWNEPSGLCSEGTYCPAASGGGPSLYIAKPSWQTGTGVPNDGARDTPDISFASSSHDGYYACLDYALVGVAGIPAGANCTASGGGYFSDFSGTSAAAPGMAGITALLNTKTGTANGNINPLLYSLAASSSSAFHDATVATSGVTNCTTATPSTCNNSTPGPSTLTGGLAGYTLLTGYDEVTGLGSLDVAKFLAAAIISTVPTISITPASTTYNLISGATTGNTDAITVASVNNFAGTVQLSCSLLTSTGTATGSCSVTPNAATLSAGSTATSTLIFTTTAGTSGALTFAVSGTSGSTTVTSATITVNLAAPAITLTPATGSLTFTSGATTGNTYTVAANSMNAFAGSVSIACSISAGTAAFQPTCAATPASVTLTAGGNATSIISISSTTAQAIAVTQRARLERPFVFDTGAFFATLLFVPVLRRRRIFRSLSTLILLVCGLAALSGCGNGGTATPSTPKSSAGTYTVTVTGTGTASGSSTSVTSTATFSLIIN